MHRESGASSNHRVVGCTQTEATWLLDRPLFAGDDTHFETGKRNCYRNGTTISLCVLWATVGERESI
jgi:hypothetical protein